MAFFAASLDLLTVSFEYLLSRCTFVTGKAVRLDPSELRQV